MKKWWLASASVLTAVLAAAGCEGDDDTTPASKAAGQGGSDSGVSGSGGDGGLAPSTGGAPTNSGPDPSPNGIVVDFTGTPQYPDPHHAMEGTNNGFSRLEPTDEEVGALVGKIPFQRFHAHAYHTDRDLVRMVLEPPWNMDFVHVVVSPKVGEQRFWPKAAGDFRRPYDPQNTCGDSCTAADYDWTGYDKQMSNVRDWIKNNRPHWTGYGSQLAIDHINEAEYKPCSFADRPGCCSKNFCGSNQNYMDTYKHWHQWMNADPDMSQFKKAAPSHGTPGVTGNSILEFVDYLVQEQLTVDFLTMHTISFFERDLINGYWKNRVQKFYDNFIQQNLTPADPYYAAGIQQLHINEVPGTDKSDRPATLLGASLLYESIDQQRGLLYVARNNGGGTLHGTFGQRLTSPEGQPEFDPQQRTATWWESFFYTHSLKARRLVKFGTTLETDKQALFTGVAALSAPQGWDASAMFAWVANGQTYEQDSREIDLTIYGAQDHLGAGTPWELQVVELPFGQINQNNRAPVEPWPMIVHSETGLTQNQIDTTLTLHPSSVFVVLVRRQDG